MEEDIVPEMRVGLEFFPVPKYAAPARWVPLEQADEPVAKELCDLVEGEVFSRTGRAFQGKAISIVVMIALEGFDD